MDPFGWNEFPSICSYNDVIAMVAIEGIEGNKNVAEIRSRLHWPVERVALLAIGLVRKSSVVDW